MNLEYHVSVNGNDSNSGSVDAPFRTISKAARLAAGGDTVTVHEGVYREWVSPAFGGESEETRVTYQAAPGETVVIKGSEQVADWKASDNGVWKAELPNELFGEYNPYLETIDGDFFDTPSNPFLHTGRVYLDGKAFREVFSVEEVREQGESWYAIAQEKTVTIYANFGSADPNVSLTEINVRKCCFYPKRTGVNYITVRGFEMAQAATPWSPPSAEQFGIIGVHWSKGWIIEDNILHDAMCGGVSLGKEASTGHNLYTRTHRKSGYCYSIEAIFRAIQLAGWTKENIGSHVVRNNTIYDCGQSAIFGNMGGVFSRIYGNHVHHIGNKHEYFGYEIAGIKLHAAIDTQIYDNYIHDCTYGIWLDWQAQGTHVSHNLFLRNEWCDLFVEVSHGPYLVDNNIFGSEFNVDLVSQGGAFVHNLFCGMNLYRKELQRSTPCHHPHSTEVTGYSEIFGGDVRFFQNIFTSPASEKTGTYGMRWVGGTAEYNGSPVSLQEYVERMLTADGADNQKYLEVKQPAYIDGNCYCNGAEAFDREENKVSCSTEKQPRLIDEDGKVYLELDIPRELLQVKTKIIRTENLEPPRIAEQPYENPDGTPLAVNTDYSGVSRGETPVPGPIEDLQAGYNKILVWQSNKYLGKAAK